MKKINIFLMLLFILFVGIVRVDAMTLKPTGDSSSGRGREVTVYITLNRSSSEKSVSAVDGVFSFDSNVFTLVSAGSLMGASWTQFSQVTNNGTFSYANLTFDSLINDTNKNIVKVVLKVNDNAAYGNSIISVKNPSATDEIPSGVSITGGTHTVRILSDNNNLSSLSISGGNINFDENTTTYNLELDKESTVISANKKDENAKITGDIGNKTLNYGLNTFKITVTSELGNTKVYTLNITRPDNRSKVNTLSSIKLSKGTIKFNSNTLNYNVDVDTDVDKIKVDATLTDSKSSFVSDFGSREVTLKEGKNEVLVKVQAENGDIKTYTINVNRKSNKSANNNLADIKLSKGTIKFKSDTLIYNVDVENNVSNIKVEAELEDDKAKFVSGYGSREVVLKEGKNTLLIKVEAENGDIKTYTVNVNRKSNKSSNNYLSEINIDNVDIKFNKDITEYEFTVLNDVTKLDIEVKTEDSKATYEILNNEELVVGNNTVIIKVKAEDESEREYKLIVARKDVNETISSNSKLKSLVVDGYDINFDSNKLEYNLKINDESSLIINYIKDDAGSSVLVNGNNDLEDGSVIDIVVRAEDGSETIYKIYIEREEKKSFLIYIIGGVIILVGIVASVLVVLKKKKNNGNKNNMNGNTTISQNVGSDIPVNSAALNAINQQPIVSPSIQGIGSAVTETPTVAPVSQPTVTPAPQVVQQPIVQTVSVATPTVAPVSQPTVTPAPQVVQQPVVQTVPVATPTVVNNQNNNINQ